MKIPQIKVLHMNWGLRLNSKAYKEVGMLMVEILPYIYQVKHADDEGAIVYVIVGEDQEKEIKELRKRFLYIDVWFEEDEDPEKVKTERLMRWGKVVRRND